MKNLRLSTLIIVALGLSLTSLIQDKPKVLIIGDSISIGYTPFVKDKLANRAQVFHNAGFLKTELGN